jgi:sterol carrier protein 2
MNRKIYVAGVGMLPFVKPGRSEPYDLMGAAAARLALDDAGVAYDLVQQACADAREPEDVCV